MNKICIKNRRMLVLLTMSMSMHYDYVLTAVRVQVPLSTQLRNLFQAGANQAATTSKYLARQASTTSKPAATAARRVAAQTYNIFQEGVQNTVSFWNSKFYKDFVEPIYVGNELSRNYLKHKKKQLEQVLESVKSFKAKIQDYLDIHPDAQQAMDNYEEMLNLFADMHDNLALDQDSPEYEEFMQQFTQRMNQALQTLDEILSRPDFKAFAITRPQVQAMLADSIPTDDAMLRPNAQEVRPVTTKPLTENDIEKIMQQAAHHKEALEFEDQAHEMLPGKPLVIER